MTMKVRKAGTASWMLAQSIFTMLITIMAPTSTSAGPVA